jgi:hypothetical protein
MPLARLSPSARLTGAVLLALWAGGFLAPAPAAASCGDYVVMPGESHSTHPSPHPVWAEQPAPSDRPTAPAPAPRCGGAECSAPGVPVTTETPNPRAAHDSWAWFAGTVPAHSSEGRSFLDLDALRGHQGLTDPIYHPPRRF